MRKLLAVAMVIGVVGCGPSRRQTNMINEYWNESQYRQRLVNQEKAALKSDTWFQSLPPEQQVQVMLYVEDKGRDEQKKADRILQQDWADEQRRREQVLQDISDSLNKMNERIKQASRDYADRRLRQSQ